MKHSYTWWLIVLVAVVFVAARMTVDRHHLTLTCDALGNEALVLSNDAGPLWMVDTAYAGAPVLSSSYLSVQHKCAHGTVAQRYRQCVELLRSEVSEDDRHRAVHGLLARGGCRAFTSGCTMRLMGIGTTSEAQADMLLCPPLRWGVMSKIGRILGTEATGDVLVTNALRGSVHILTTDYLLHRSPCVIQPRVGLLQLRARYVSPRGFQFHPARFAGGAFVVDLVVGGATMAIVVDTGAAAALSLGKSAATRMTGPCKAEAHKATQAGVHGERVCSDVVTTTVRFGPTLAFEDVEVFLNDGDVEAADGYAGMGLLRAVDLWLEPTAIGFRPSGLLPKRSEATATGGCDRPLPSVCGGDKKIKSGS